MCFMCSFSQNVIVTFQTNHEYCELRWKSSLKVLLVDKKAFLLICFCYYVDLPHHISKPKTLVKVKLRVKVSFFKKHTDAKRQQQKLVTVGKKQLCFGTALCSFCVVLREKNEWSFFYLLFIYLRSAHPSWIACGATKKNMEKVHPSRDVKRDQKGKNKTILEWGQKAPTATWQTVLTCPQKTACFIDICLRYSAGSLEENLRFLILHQFSVVAVTMQRVNKKGAKRKLKSW